MELSAIQDVASRVQGRAFSLRLPLEKVSLFTTNWPESIEVEEMCQNPRIQLLTLHGSMTWIDNTLGTGILIDHPKITTVLTLEIKKEITSSIRPAPQNHNNPHNKDLWRTDTAYQWRRDVLNQSEEKKCRC